MLLKDNITYGNFASHRIIKKFYFKLIFYLSLLLSESLSEVSENGNTNQILPSNYSRDNPPVVDGKPVEVNIAVNVLSLLHDSDDIMAFNVDLFYHQYWTDHRLQTPIGLAPNTTKYTLNYQWKDRIWVPDTYFRNAIGGGVANVLFPSLYFTITDRINVFMAARLQMKLSCDMNFKKYPFDTQTCFIRITTLSETVDMVELKWLSFIIGNHVELPEYEITDSSIDECAKYYDIGTFSCIIASIHLKRNIGNYLIKRYIPSFLIVIMSFIGFWIPTSVPPARVSLTITALLALIAQQIQVELNVSYVYALEVWTIICILFVFATLIEYSIAIAWPLDELTSAQENNKGVKKILHYIKAKPGPRNSSIDIISRVLFPIMFAITIITYSIVYYLI